MGTYFNNETLDALWVRLVNATEEITGSSLPNTGIKSIHDALLSYYGLAHENTPTTPGDYMKGIAVAARYKKDGTEEPYMSWSLEQIVEELESIPVAPTYSCSLSSDMILTLDQSGYETGFYLYDADTDEELYSHSADGATTYDLKDYYTNFVEGNRYYAVGRWWNGDGVEYNARSNTIRYVDSGAGGGDDGDFYGSITLNQDEDTGYISIEAENMYMNVITATLFGPVDNYTEQLYSANGTDNTAYAFKPSDYWESHLQNMTDSGLDIEIKVVVTQFIDGDAANGDAGSASKTITYIYNSNSGGGDDAGPRDLPVNPDAYLMNEGRVYISNYVGPEWEGLDVDITYYYNGVEENCAIFTLGADGYVQDCYLDSAAEWSYELSLHDRTNNGDSHTDIVWISKSV